MDSGAEAGVPETISPDDETFVPGDKAREFGRFIAQAREAANLSQEEVARRLYLSPDLIRRIDTGDLDALPKPAYVRGYLRAYARLVSLSGDDLVSRFDALGRVEPEQPRNLQPVTEEEVGSAKLTGPVATTGFWSLGAIALILLIVWGLSGEEERASPPVAGNESVDLEALPDRAVATEARVRGPRVTDEDAMRMPADAMQGTVDDARGLETTGTVYTGEQVSIEISSEEDEWRAIDEEPPDDESAVAGSMPAGDRGGAPLDLAEAPGSDTSVVEATDGTSITIDRRTEGARVLVTVAAGGEDHLHFAFTGDCWIEVSVSGGVVLYEDLHHEGDEVNLYGSAPFRVLAGRAQAVAILFNDKPVELVPSIVNNTARVELGT